MNVRCECGVIHNRVIPSALAGTDPKLIDLIWLVNEQRQATPAEVKALCFGCSTVRRRGDNDAGTMTGADSPGGSGTEVNRITGHFRWAKKRIRDELPTNRELSPTSQTEPIT